MEDLDVDGGYVRMILTKIRWEGVQWIHVAKEGSRKWFPIITVLRFWRPQNMEKFLEQMIDCQLYSSVEYPSLYQQVTVQLHSLSVRPSLVFLKHEQMKRCQGLWVNTTAV